MVIEIGHSLRGRGGGEVGHRDATTVKDLNCKFRRG